MNNIPASRPKTTRSQLMARIKAAYPDFVPPDFFTCGIRGYYLDSMGKTGENDRNIYDDAAFIVGKDDFAAFNGNTDPAAFKLQIATLKPGIWNVYKLDLHKGQYLALCQRYGPVTVTRDGVAGEQSGMFGINQHRGGVWGTSSLGCQTIPPEQYTEWIDKVTELLKKYYGKAYRDTRLTYVLLENTPQLNAEPPAAE
jgi:hypothetical protein